jgi:lycopene cyclase domain-containing protein
MFIVNGLLTALPVVEYNGTVFSNIRLFDIPIEDFSYFLLLMLMNVFVYEKSKQLMLAKKSS